MINKIYLSVNAVDLNLIYLSGDEVTIIISESKHFDTTMKQFRVFCPVDIIFSQ